LPTTRSGAGDDGPRTICAQTRRIAGDERETLGAAPQSTLDRRLSMSQARRPTRTRPPGEQRERTRPRRESANTADGLVAQRAAFAERERRTAQARTAARRLGQAAEPRA
jgi:hypothetical protein